MKTILINTNGLLSVSTSKYNIEKIQKIINIKSKEKVNKLIEFIDNILTNMKEHYSDKYPEHTFYKYNGKIYFELNVKNNGTFHHWFGIAIEGFWKKYQIKLPINYKKIKDIISYMLGIHLKRKPPIW